MDLLLNIVTTKINSPNDFEIVVEKIENGWMTLLLGTANQKHSYKVSYTCDPLNDLLQSTVLVLLGQTMKNVDHIQFDLESQGVLHWVLRKIDTKWYTYLWHNTIYKADFIDMYEADFDSTTYKENKGADFEGFPRFETGLLCALETQPTIWAQIIRATFEKVAKKFNPNDFDDPWGVTYNQTNFKALEQNC